MKSIDLDWLVDLIPDAALLVSQHQVVVAANTRADALFAAPPGGLCYQNLEALIPEEARRVHRRNVDEFFQADHCRPMGNALRYQGRRLDGRLLPMDIMLNRVRIADQALTMAIIRDDSDRQAIRQVRDQLDVVNSRLTRAQEVGGLGWWELDLPGPELRWSPMVPALLGLPEQTEPALDCFVERCHPEDRQALLIWHQALPEAGERQRVYRICLPGGEVRWIQETIDLGTDNRVLGVIRDITTEKVLEDRLRRESVTDELTGLYNRKQFNRDLKSGYSSFVRGHRNSALIMYDFDHFKNINDCHGHMAGDKVLSQSAMLVSDQLRSSDHAYRLGGEEFAIIVNDTSIADAHVMADRIRRSVERMAFCAGDAIIRATVSMGVAQFRNTDTRFDDVLRRADEALYQSKAFSRNAVSVLE
ncbi:diguanylate cyclase [Marinobacter sp.]|uniref:sensor domain-containing diguanylate cyclase n=1 Tax=Marinobacter sp. TaxID=50741 RepID=UPI003565EBBB